MTAEMQKADRYLSQIRNLAFKINAISEALTELESRNPANLKAMQFDTIKVQTSGGDPMLNYIAAEGRYKADLLAIKTAYSENRKEAINRITRLENGISIEILTRRYVLCQPWETVSMGIHYNIRHAQFLRLKALDEFYNANTDLWSKIQ